jgi:hypothetical protein
MINLNDINLSYIIATPEIDGLSQTENTLRTNKFLNLLYSMNYSIVPIWGFQDAVYEKYYIAFTSEDNHILEKESKLLINQFCFNELMMKFKGDTLLTRVLWNGEKFPVEVKYYDNSMDKKVFIHEGITFTLNEQKRYYFPSKKEHLKEGMIVEYFNNNLWHQKVIQDLDTEYEKMYKLFMKYEKLRVNY